MTLLLTLVFAGPSEAKKNKARATRPAAASSHSKGKSKRARARREVAQKGSRGKKSVRGKYASRGRRGRHVARSRRSVRSSQSSSDQIASAAPRPAPGIPTERVTEIQSANLLKKLGVPKRSSDGYAVPVNRVSENEKKKTPL